MKEGRKPECPEKTPDDELYVHHNANCLTRQPIDF